MASHQMDLQKSCDILGLTKEKLDKKSIRRAYTTAALRYHPDKNPQEGNKFLDINTAYEFLKSYLPEHEEDSVDNLSTSYSDLLTNFIYINTGVHITTDKLSRFFNGVRTECDQLLYNSVKCMKRDDAISVYSYISKFKDVIGIDQDMLSSIEGVVKSKMEADELIILRPLFSQLFEPNLFPLEYNGEKYYVPLWHEEVEFDVKDKSKTIVVRVAPELPIGIMIDETGSVFVEARKSITTLLSSGFVDVDVGPEKIRIMARDVLVKPLQTLVFKGRGIILMDCQNILSSAGRGDIRINLELTY